MLLRNNFFLGLCLLLLMAAPGCKRPMAKQSNAVTLVGTVYETRSYCGGAAPSEDRLARLKAPRPLPGKTAYIKAGDSNDPDAPVVAEITSDDRGEFTVALEPGTYVMVDEKRVDKASYNYMMTNFAEKTETYGPVDKACLDKWVVQADLVFEVKDEGNEVLNVTFHTPCSWNSFPCVTFIGARPR